jgi:hypothetical protein
MYASETSGSRHAVRLAWIVALLLMPCVSGCTSWVQTRSRFVEPVHRLLHHAWPDHLAEGDGAGLRGLFESEQASLPSRALRAGFAEVQYAEGDVEHVDAEVEPVHAWVRLRLDGTDPEGRPRTVIQRREVELAHHGDVWRIAADHAEPAHVVAAPSSGFRDEARLRGLWFVHEEKPPPAPAGEPRRYPFGSGVAAIDLDHDGFDDVLLATGRRIELFRNEAGYFERVSEQWGLGSELAIDEGTVLNVVLPADFDGDGDDDLFVGAEYGQPLLLRNAGGRFVPMPDAGITTRERTIGASAADFDGDGRLDLFLANHEDVYRNAPDLPYARNAQRDQLFLGDGAGGFAEVGRDVGIDNSGWSLAPAPADFDGDGDVDLFVGNDFGFDVLLRNEGGRFVDVSDASGVKAPVAAMGATWGDYDADGDLDLFVSGMASGSGWVIEIPQFRIRGVPWFVDALFRPYVREAVRSWFLGNRLYENLGEGRFREHAAESGVAWNGWGWGAAWLDFDNDGLLDLYAANGFLSGPLKDDL